MRLHKFLFIIALALATSIARGDDDLRLQLIKLGYSDETRADFSDEAHPEYLENRTRKRTVKHRVFHNRTGGLDLGGSTGMIDLPTAFTHKPEHTTFSAKFLYARGSFMTREDTFNRNKSIYFVQLLHGLSRNAEIGLSQTRLNSELETITGTTGFRNYSPSAVLNTLSMKFAFFQESLQVAIGGHVTDLAAEDQILVDINDNERLNDVYIALSEDFGPKLLGHIVVRNSFFRGSDNRVLMASNDNTLTAGIGLEYNHNREYTLIAEAKKVYSDYVVRPDDLALNLGIRYEGTRLLFDANIHGLNDNSTTSYSYGVGYRF